MLNLLALLVWPGSTGGVAALDLTLSDTWLVPDDGQSALVPDDGSATLACDNGATSLIPD